MLKKIPHLAASGALTPAFDLLAEFLSRLNVGLLSEAISETLRSFSIVAFTRLTNDLIKASANNQGLRRTLQKTLKDRSLLSFLALQIFRCASISLVSVTGASMGAAVGSVIAPGPGSIIGGYLGNQILTIAAKIIVYQLTSKMPFKRNIRRMLAAWHMLVKNPGDIVARAAHEDASAKIEKKIINEFNNEKFKLFEMLLKEIDKMSANDRQAMIRLLKNLQVVLNNKVINDGDWYYARKYYLLRDHVERWGLQKQIVFSAEPTTSQR